MTVPLPAILIASMTLVSAAYPASGADTPKSGVVSLIVENDSFYGNDEQYTNGIALTWVPTDGPAPSWVVRIAQWLPWFPKNAELHHGYVFGQNIQPSVPGLGFFVPADQFAWYLFAGFEGRAVARNIFLDGNTFHDSRSVDKELLVGDLQGGIVLTWRGVRLTYTHVLRSPEFDGQDDSEQFGSVSLSVGF